MNNLAMDDTLSKLGIMKAIDAQHFGKEIGETFFAKKLLESRLARDKEKEVPGNLSEKRLKYWILSAIGGDCPNCHKSWKQKADHGYDKAGNLVWTTTYFLPVCHCYPICDCGMVLLRETEMHERKCHLCGKEYYCDCKESVGLSMVPTLYTGHVCVKCRGSKGIKDYNLLSGDDTRDKERRYKNGERAENEKPAPIQHDLEPNENENMF